MMDATGVFKLGIGRSTSDKIYRRNREAACLSSLLHGTYRAHDLVSFRAMAMTCCRSSLPSESQLLQFPYCIAVYQALQGLFSGITVAASSLRSSEGSPPVFFEGCIGRSRSVGKDLWDLRRHVLGSDFL